MAFLLAPFVSGIFGPHPVLKAIPWIIETFFIFIVAMSFATAKPVAELSTFTCNHWIVSDFYDGRQYTVDGKTFEFHCGKVMSGSVVKPGLHATTLHDCVEMCTQQDGCVGTSYTAHDRTCHLLSSQVFTIPYKGQGEAVAATLVPTDEQIESEPLTNHLNDLAVDTAILATLPDSRLSATSATTHDSQTQTASSSMRNTRPTTIPITIPTTRTAQVNSIKTKSSVVTTTTTPVPTTVVRISNRPNRNREPPSAEAKPKFQIFLGHNSAVQVIETSRPAAMTSSETASTIEISNTILKL